MPTVVKARPIERTKTGKRPYRITFKPSTPLRIILDAEKRYARYLKTADDAEYVPVTKTAWYKQMSKEMTPARYLKTYREIAEYSQAQLGKLAGLPASRISDYETGQRSISKDVAKKLSDIFKVSPAVFI